MNIFQQLILQISSLLLLILPTTQYTEGLIGQPETFFPHQAITQNDKTISNLIYKGLFTYDIYGNLVPDLAESWAVSGDGTRYTVKLKPDLKWSDGSSIVADDLIYTAFKTPDLQGVATDKIDDLTVQYTLPNQYSPFPSLLTVDVMKNQTEETQNPLKPITNGEFAVLNVKKAGPLVKEILLQNKDNEANIKKLSFKYYTNEDELVIASKLGEIDGFLSDKVYSDLQNMQNHRLALQGVYYALYFNTQNQPLDDIEIRQKLEKVINIEQQIADKGIFVEGPISRSPFTDKELQFNKYDSEFTEDLELDLELIIPDLKTHQDMATRIKTIWKESLDVNTKIVSVPADEIVESYIKPRKYQILLFGQEVGRDPDRYVNWHSTQSEAPGLNLSKFEQVRADNALEAGRTAVNNDERVPHYNEFQKVIVEYVPAIFLYHPYKSYYINKNIKGVGEKTTFSIHERFSDFGNWRVGE